MNPVEGRFNIVARLVHLGLGWSRIIGQRLLLLEGADPNDSLPAEVLEIPVNQGIPWNVGYTFRFKLQKSCYHHSATKPPAV